jgi:cytochrome P450
MVRGIADKAPPERPVEAPPRPSLRDIPGPTGNPFVGMAMEFRRGILQTLLRGFHEYGDIVAYRFGPVRGPLRQYGVAAHHPDLVRQVLTESERTYGKDTVGFQILSDMLGRGLLTTEGDLWRRQRRTLAPLFTPRRVAHYADLMQDEAKRVVEGSRRHAGVGQPDPTATAGGSDPVDLHLLMMRYTLRVVGRALFGEDVDEAIPALHRLVPLAGRFTQKRTLQFVRFPLDWPTPRNRRMRMVRAQQYEIVDRILARHAGTDESRDDLVSRLQAARDPETGEPLSDAEIRDQVLVFLLAGHETTAGALTFTLHLLGRRPALQEKAAGDDQLLRASLLEGMRLFPPAYLTERLTLTDTEIGGYAIPRRTLVVVSPWVTHRHPGFWAEPERFDPYRFLAEHGRPRYAYFPFGGGPRSCIGEHFAMLEAEILLRTLLRRYRVESADGSLQTAAHVTLRPAGPVLARLHPR